MCVCVCLCGGGGGGGGCVCVYDICIHVNTCIATIGHGVVPHDSCLPLRVASYIWSAHQGKTVSFRLVLLVVKNKQEVGLRDAGGLQVIPFWCVRLYYVNGSVR